MPSTRQLFLRYLGQTSPEPLLLEIERAEGIWLYGPGGKKYIDLVSGVSVSNIGHGNPSVVEAVVRQAAAHMHLMVYGEMIQSPQLEYARTLASLLPGTLGSVYFVNSGSEAVEGALKLARRYTSRQAIVSFGNAYHGSTLGALSVQGSDQFTQPFKPLIPGVTRLPFNHCGSISEITAGTACVIVEPVQAEAGVVAATGEFLVGLRERCNETGALLVFDECQTGFGRTGTMFALERYGVVPDILVLAKALGGGMPLGAFISSPDIMSSLSFNPVLGHITTFGGHPVCCAAGLASTRYLVDNGVVSDVSAKGNLFRELLVHPIITTIRGEGLLLAVVLSESEYTGKIVGKAPEYGLITDYFLFCGDAFRIAPPLTITEDEIREACRRLLKLLDDISRG